MTRVHVAVCIVAFRNLADVRGCLEALAHSTHTDFEVVICENGGEPAYRTLLSAVGSSLPSGQQIRALSAPGNPGYAGGVNICIEASPEADAWWVLNPDTTPDREALSRLVARLQRGDCQAVGSTVHDGAGIVGSRGGRWNAWLARAASLEHGLRLGEGRPAAELEAQVNYLSGASMLVGRAFMEQVGQMREDYFLYAEEVEWCLRARALGCTFGLATDAHILHQQGTTTGSVGDMAGRQRMPVYLDERNKVLVTRDRFPARLPVAAVAALLLIILRFGKRRAWRQLGYGLSGWLAGLRNERGKPKWLKS